jgi:hypothetical protein
MGDSIFSANNATTEKNLADRFIIDKLLKGLQLTENDPVYQFRKQLLKIKTATNIVGGSRISHNIMIMGGITTWNKWVKGKTARSFKLPDTNFMPRILLP